MHHASPLATRRLLILRAAWTVLIAWILLRLASPFIAQADRMTFPAWAALIVLYTLDRPLRFRLLYEGFLGTLAYFILHDIPIHLHLGALQPHTHVQFLTLLVITGAVAALPFGRRGPAVAAASGLLLGSLWILYRFESLGFALRVVPALRGELLPGLVFVTLGGLLSERLTRSLRGDPAAPGASWALWGFVLGAATNATLGAW